MYCVFGMREEETWIKIDYDENRKKIIQKNVLISW